MDGTATEAAVVPLSLLLFWCCSNAKNERGRHTYPSHRPSRGNEMRVPPSAVGPLLVEAVKELRDLVETLQHQLDALEENCAAAVASGSGGKIARDSRSWSPEVVPRKEGASLDISASKGIGRHD